MSTGVYGTIYLTGARTPMLDRALAAANEKVARTPYLSDPDDPYELPAYLPVGILLTPKSPDRPDDFTPAVASIYRYAGLDNGFFSESGKRRFEKIGIDGYIELGLKAQRLWGDNFLFITAPDSACAEIGVEGVVACRSEQRWRQTLEMSLAYLPAMMAAGLPASLVLQNGATPDNIPWKQIRSIFLGGNTSWKVSPVAYACAKEARRRGLEVHMGRVNTLQRMRIAEEFGCDSADGTYLLHEEKKGNEAEGVRSILGWAQDSLYRRQVRDQASRWRDLLRSGIADEDRDVVAEAREGYKAERELRSTLHKTAMAAIERENAAVARMDAQSADVQRALSILRRMPDLPRRIWPALDAGRSSGRRR